jgi:hypothetical protein
VRHTASEAQTAHTAVVDLERTAVVVDLAHTGLDPARTALASEEAAALERTGLAVEDPIGARNSSSSRGTAALAMETPWSDTKGNHTV